MFVFYQQTLKPLTLAVGKYDTSVRKRLFLNFESYQFMRQFVIGGSLCSWRSTLIGSRTSLQRSLLRNRWPFARRSRYHSTVSRFVYVALVFLSFFLLFFLGFEGFRIVFRFHSKIWSCLLIYSLGFWSFFSNSHLEKLRQNFIVISVTRKWARKSWIATHIVGWWHSSEWASWTTTSGFGTFLSPLW